MKHHNIALFIMLFFSASSLVSKEEHLREVRIRNDFDGMVDVTLNWRQDDAPHTKNTTNPSIKKGDTQTFKAPLLGYKIEEVKAESSATVAAIAVSSVVAGVVAPAIAIAAGSAAGVCSDGKIDAHGDEFFVLKGKGGTKSVQIWRYKNEAAYTAEQKQIDQVKAFKQSDIAALNQADIAALTNIQIAYLTPAQKAFFSPAQVAFFSADQMKYFAEAKKNGKKLGKKAAVDSATPGAPVATAAVVNAATPNANLSPKNKINARRFAAATPGAPVADAVDAATPNVDVTPNNDPADTAQNRIAVRRAIANQ